MASNYKNTSPGSGPGFDWFKNSEKLIEFEIFVFHYFFD